MSDRVTLPVNPEMHNKLYNALISWYIQSKPGDWFVYHTGYSLHENLSVERAREAAWILACKGKIYLFLKRDPVDKNQFVFMCQKSTNPTRRLVPIKEK